MKKFLLLAWFSFQIGFAMTQITFENISYDAAFLRSKQTGKLVFLQFESQNCKQCNEVADKAFSDKNLGEMMNQTFICIKITATHPDRKNIIESLKNPHFSFGSLYFTSDGSLIHTFPKTTTVAKSYEEETGKALTKAGEGYHLKSLEQLYNEGNRSISFLELYMKTLKGLHMNTDKLLDEYISLLPEDSIKSKRTFVFVVGMTPLLESFAYQNLGKFYEAINKKLYTANYPLHESIKNSIAYKSLKKAIAEKNESYAFRIAAYAKAIYPTDLAKGARAYDSKLVEYYDGIKDTAKYLLHASNYYNKYFMSISPDSVKRIDTINMKELFEKQTASIEKKGDSTVMKKQIRYSLLAQRLGDELSDAAKNFYEMAGDTIYLANAFNWSKKSLEFSENPKTLNTHALLLNMLGRKKEAVLMQEKAILLKKKQGFDTESFEKELKEMQ